MRVKTPSGVKMRIMAKDMMNFDNSIPLFFVEKKLNTHKA
jgi:hypothetical protein